MDELLVIYVDRLSDGQREQLAGTCSPHFIDTHDKDLEFQNSVSFGGEAYVCDERLLIHLHTVKTIAMVTCIMCLSSSPIPVMVSDLYISRELSEIPSGKYYFGEELREHILLETPDYAECNGGCCPQRKGMEKYLKQ